MADSTRSLFFLFRFFSLLAVDIVVVIVVVVSAVVIRSTVVLLVLVICGAGGDAGKSRGTPCSCPTRRGYGRSRRRP